MDRARVLARLDELSREAQGKNQMSAAIRAEELLGRAMGMFRDRSETEITVHGLSLADALEAGRRRVQEMGRAEVVEAKALAQPATE